MPFTHLLIKVPTAEFEAIVKFYTAALKPTGYKLIMDRPGFAGLGAASPDFFIKASDDAPTTNTHVAFPAPGMYTDQHQTKEIHPCGVRRC